MPQLITIPRNGRHRASLLNNPKWRAEHIPLTRSQYINKHAFSRLPFWQRRRAVTAAVRRSTKTAVITGFAAADLYGIATLDFKRSMRVDLVLPEHRKPPSRHQWTNWVSYRSCHLPTEDITEINNTPVVTLARLFVDIIALHDELEGLAFIESVLNNERLVNNGYDKKYFQSYLTRNKGAWGMRQAQKVLDMALYSIQSPFETLARWLIIKEPRLRGAEVIPQAVIPTMTADGYKARRLDLLLFGWLAIEIDGQMKYTDAVAAAANMSRGEYIQSERKRETLIQNMGYHFIRLRPNQVVTTLIPLIEKSRELCPKHKSPKKHIAPDLTLAYFERNPDVGSEWEYFHRLTLR